MPADFKTMEVGMTGNADKVLGAMKKAAKPLRPGDIAGMTGLSKDDVAKAVAELKKADKITSPKRCFWEPAG